MNVILSGMPGSGKTTVLGFLSKELGYAAADTDDIITQRHGPISDIFAKYGEGYFRQIESAVVLELSKKSGLVISTGGGCLVNPQNVKLFKSCGKIVFLRTSLNELCRRLRGDDTRPLLRGGLQNNLQKLWRERAPVYEAAADLAVDTDGLTPQEISHKITELLNI